MRLEVMTTLLSQLLARPLMSTRSSEPTRVTSSDGSQARLGAEDQPVGVLPVQVQLRRHQVDLPALQPARIAASEI